MSSTSAATLCTPDACGPSRRTVNIFVLHSAAKSAVSSASRCTRTSAELEVEILSPDACSAGPALSDMIRSNSATAHGRNGRGLVSSGWGFTGERNQLCTPVRQLTSLQGTDQCGQRDGARLRCRSPRAKANGCGAPCVQQRGRCLLPVRTSPH